jgi:hypothetical protein
MKYLFVNTTQAGAGRLADSARLVSSIVNQRRPDRELRLVMLIQRAASTPAEYLALANSGIHIEYSTSPTALSLSSARNLLIMRELEMSDYDWVFFPDDDCFYQEGFLDFVEEIHRSKNADLLLIGNDLPPKPIPIAFEHAVKLSSVFDAQRSVNSNGIGVTGELLAKVGRFDEGLGVGTPMGGGEDSDFATRAFRGADHPITVTLDIVGHRKMNGSFATRFASMKKYWPGVARQTISNFEPSLLGLLLYRVAVGILLLCTSGVSPRLFVEALFPSRGEERSLKAPQI